jgi:hypothetical protein
MKLLIAAALFSFPAWAQSPPASSGGLDLNPHSNYGAIPPKDDKNSNKEFVTRERYVNIGGVQYKQIEYNGQFYTVNARQSETFVDCSRTDLPPDTFAADATVKVTKHTGLYMESLRQHCDPKSNSIMTSPDMRDANIGVKFKGDGPDATEKKIYVSPLKKMGGVGTTF